MGSQNYRDSSKEEDNKKKYVAHVFGNVHPPAQRELGVGLYKKLTELFASGDLKVRFGVRRRQFLLIDPFLVF